MIPQQRHLRTQPAIDPERDEPLWPANVALLVLGGFIAGLIVARSDFQTPNFWRNGWTHFGLLAASGVLLIVAMWLGGKRGLRLQRAAQISLLGHGALFFYLAMSDFPLPLADKVDANKGTHTKIVLHDLSTVVRPFQEQKVEVFDRPVATQAPVSEPVEVAPRPERNPEASAPVAPTKMVEAVPVPSPNTLAMASMKPAEFAAPRKSDQESKLSKSTPKVALPIDQVAAPESPKTTQPTDQALDATATAPARREADARVSQRSSKPEGLDDKMAVALVPREAIPRGLPDQKPTEAAPKPALEHIAKIPSPATAEIGAPKLSEKSESKSPEIGPAASGAQKSDGGLHMARGTSDPSINTPAVVAQAAGNRPRTAEDQPQLAPGKAGPARSTTGPLAMTTAPILDSAIRSPKLADSGAGEGSSALKPGAMKLAKGAPGGISGGPANDPNDVEPATPGGTALAGLKPTRVEGPAGAGSQPAINPGGGLARASSISAIPTSPINIDSPPLASSASAKPLTAEPTQVAVGRLGSGPGGFGSTVKLDSGLSSGLPGGVGPVAAQLPRSDTAQPTAQGMSGVTSGPGVISRAPAGKGAPTAALVAQDVKSGEVTGGGNIASPEPGPSGLAARNEEGARNSIVNVRPVGGGDVGSGPTSIATTLPGSHSAGGGQPGGNTAYQGAGDGQPTITAGVAGGPLGRSQVGGATPGIATTVEGKLPAAPHAGEGGGADAPAIGPETIGTVAVKSGGGGGLPTGSQRGSGAGEPGAGGAPVATASIGRADGPDGTSSIAGDGSQNSLGSGGRGLGPSATRSGAGGLTIGTQAETPQVASTGTTGGGGEGGGSKDGGVDALGSGVQRRVEGTPGVRSPNAGDSVGGGLATDGPAGSAAVGLPTGLNPGGREDVGPSVSGKTGTGPARSAAGVGLPDGMAQEIASPKLPSGSPSGGGTADVATSAEGDDIGPASGAPARGTTGGGLPVQVAAAEGPGGLGADLTPHVGSLSRQARRDGEVLASQEGRFLQRSTPTGGGLLAVDGRVRESAESFERKGRKERGPGDDEDGRPSARTENAIELGLEFLAKHQSANGSWSLNDFPGATEADAGSIVSDTAATGLALLAFLGAGYDHYDDKYKDVVRRGLEFLLENQRENGDLYIAADSESNQSAWFYSHGIASIALCEAFGMTGDEKLRVPAQKSLDFIIASQHPTRGGWRYSPRISSDMSVSGWQLMALKSGELAHLKVPPETINNIRKWLDSAEAGKNDPSQYVYNPLADDSRRQGREPNRTMTAVGLLMRMYTGWNHDNPDLKRGVDHLLASLPEAGSGTDAGTSKRDTYYWYYATQVMYHMKGDAWKKWNERLHPLLVNSQVQDGPMAGSWDPRNPVPDRWGPHGGRIYVTTMNLLSLEVYYRHLPIYDSVKIAK